MALTNRFDGLLDVICPVEVLVGCGSITGRACLELRPSSVIRLSQAAGADLDVRIRGISIASGEIVVIEETTAVRITEVAPPPNAEATS